MYIVFPIRFNRLQWCNVYLASLPRWRTRFDSHGRKYFFVFNLIFPIFYIFCNKNLVEFYIKFNALAKSSHQPLFFFFFINFQTQTALSQLWLQISGYVIFLSSHLAKFVRPFYEVKVSNIPHSKSLLILKSGYMYSAVFCAVMHGILLYIFS